MKKIPKPITITLLILLALYLSFDIHRMDSQQARPGTEVFDVEEYTNELWENELYVPIEKALDTESFLDMLAQNPQQAFDDYSNQLGISNTFYFMLKGQGTISEVREESLVVKLNETLEVELATVFIFGNAIREASGLVDIDDFLNMMDFNMVSVYLNRRAKAGVVEPLLKKVKPGMPINFVGATEINREKPQPGNLLIIPVQIQLNHE